MTNDPIKTIKDWHVRVCIAVTMLFSLFVFASGFRFEHTVWRLPWWAALVYGYCSLVVCFQLSKIWYKDTKD